MTEGWKLFLSGFGGATFGAVASSIFHYLQLLQSRCSMRTDILLRLDESFNSERMRNIRRRAAKYLLEHLNVTNEDELYNRYVDYLLDFFELIGMLLHKKAIDGESAWNLFVSFIDYYWDASELYIKEARQEQSTIWQELVYMHEAFMSISERKGERKLPFSERMEDLREFLEEESKLS